MEKHLRYLLIIMLLMTASGTWANNVTFDATLDVSSTKTLTKNGISITISSGALGNSSDYRIYKGSTITLSSTSGNITNVVFNCTVSGDAQYGPGCFTGATAGTYTYSEKTGTWTGDATSFTLTASTNQVRCTSIVVTYSSSLKPANLTFSESSISLEKGSTFTAPTFTKETTAGVSFTSSNQDVATVSENGVIALAGNEGTTTITASSDANDTYEAGAATCVITVFHYVTFNKVSTITSGKDYLLVAQRDSKTNYANPLDPTKTYGYLNVSTLENLTDAVKVPSNYNDAFTITSNGDGYSIQQAEDSRYLYNDASHNTFSIQANAPTGTWAITPNQDGTFKIAYGTYYVQWGQGTYTTFGLYTSDQDGTVYPLLYQKSETSDGINTINNNSNKVNADAPVFSISGVKMNSKTLPTGIYIKNKKKFVVK